MTCLKTRLASILALLWAAAGVAAAQSRTVAITIDDLPVAQSGDRACEIGTLEPHTRQILKPFVERGVPLTAFVIGGKCADISDDDRRRILKMWEEAGVEIGNHSYSHTSFSSTPPDEYEADILRADRSLSALMGGPMRSSARPCCTPERRRSIATGSGSSCRNTAINKPR